MTGEERKLVERREAKNNRILEKASVDLQQLYDDLVAVRQENAKLQKHLAAARRENAKLRQWLRALGRDILAESITTSLDAAD